MDAIIRAHQLGRSRKQFGKSKTVINLLNFCNKFADDPTQFLASEMTS